MRGMLTIGVMNSRPGRQSLVLVGVIVLVLAMVMLIAVVRAQERYRGPSLITFLGDSYTAGSPMDSGFASRFPAIIGDRLDMQPIVGAEPGAGWVQPGVTGESFSQEVASVSPDSELVVIYGSRNDALDGSAAASVEQSALGLLSAIRKRAPDATVVVFGPSFVEDPTPPGALGNADAVRRACRSIGVEYVDTTKWLHGLPQGYIGSDRIHPTDSGHAYLATRMLPVLEKARR